MSDTLPSAGTNETRLVTVADLRYELDRERELTNAQFREFGAKLSAVNESVTLLRQTGDGRFEQVDKRFDQIDKRFDQVDKRFDQIDKRFDALDIRLRSNKTLAVMSLTAAASIASVVITLLK
ncbi:MAG: hypothetical protein FJW13_01815 [Actinobacteria bacterium]|nr:hypothetical protein [Actinomycetota bacterium]